MKITRWMHVLTILYIFLTRLSGFRNSFYKPLRFSGSALNGVRRGKLFRSKFVSQQPPKKQDSSKSHLDESATSILPPTNLVSPINRFKVENDEESKDSLGEVDEDDVSETEDEDDDDDESDDGEIEEDLEELPELLEKVAFDSVNKHLEKVFAIDNKKKKGTPAVSIPEEDCIGTKFNRKVHISQIPRRKTTICRLVANETERLYLAKEFEIPELDYFAANMSLSFKDPYTLAITGRVEGKVTLFHLDVSETFTTVLLCNHGNKIPKNLENEETYHDVIPADGFLDVGSIACDYFRFGLG
jgi:hypothetical protein